MDSNIDFKQERENEQVNDVYAETLSMTAFTFQENIRNYCNDPSFEVMSMQEMVNLLGGCAGSGICYGYSHSCPSNCTYLSARKCSGISGNCVNEYYVPLCRCDWGYYWTKGCM